MKTVFKVLAAAALSAAAAGYIMWQNNALSVSEYSYSSDKITPDMDGFKIVHVSDLHNKEFGKNNARLISLIDKSRPDIIVISGDLADSRRTDIDAAVRFVKSASAIAPVYFTTGNHEHRLEQSELSELLERLEDAGAVLLLDKKERIVCKDSVIYIGGISDVSADRGLGGDMFSDNKDSLCLLILHRPQLAGYYAGCGADLIFSGHAHGGQVRIPFVGGLLAPDQGFFPKLSEGMHRLGGSHLVISRGLGNSLIPLRINNPPELVAVTLRSEICR